MKRMLLAVSAMLALGLPANGQDTPSGTLHAGRSPIVVTFRTDKPLKFTGGSLAVDLVWKTDSDSSGGAFVSSPLPDTRTPVNPSLPVVLKFHPRFNGNYDTWGLMEIDGVSIADYKVQFLAGSTAASVDGRIDGLELSYLASLGVTSFRLTQ